MTWILLAAAWLVLAVGVALLLGGVIQSAGRQAAEDRRLIALEADLRSASSLPAAHEPRTPTAG